MFYTAKSMVFIKNLYLFRRRFDDGQPDYVDRLKKSLKAGTPLIPALLPYCDGKSLQKFTAVNFCRLFPSQ